MILATERPRLPRLSLILCGVGIAVVTLLVFQPVGGYPFLTSWDDGAYVTENVNVRAGVTPATIRWAFTSFEAANWHPLTWLSHLLDVELFGMNAGAHHLSSVALHIAAALLLLSVLDRLTGSLWRSAAVSLLFAIHPLHVESVIRISSRKDVLSATLWMLTIAAYLRYLRRPGRVRYLLLVLAFSLGLMAKPMVVTLPLVLLFLDYWPLGRFEARTPGSGCAIAPSRTAVLKRLLLEKASLFALAALGSVLTWIAQATIGNAAISLRMLPVALRLSNAVVSYATYLANMVVPRGLTFFYPYPIDGHSPAKIAAAVVLLAAVTLWALRECRRQPFLLTGWGWYLATLLPVSGIVQVGMQARADRYTYLPLIGVFVLLVWSLPPLSLRQRGRSVTVIAAAGLITILLAADARIQLGYWSDTETLTRHALAVTTGNWVAQANLGSCLTADGREEEGLQQYRAAEASVPARAERHFRNALLLAGQGRDREAAVEYNRASELYLPYVMANFNLAVLESRTGDVDQAARHLRAAIAYRPDFLEAHFARGVILAQRGELEEAAAHFAEVVRFRPDYPGARHNLEAVLESLEIPPERFEDYLRGRSWQPGPALERF